jgi:hypothetical protein
MLRFFRNTFEVGGAAVGDITNSKSLAAARWFGYGQWSAEYWFVGMEPGGSDEDATYDSWLRLGGGELIDCKAHHLACGCVKWHVGFRRRTQATWRRLIQVQLAFEGKPTDLDAVWQLQRGSFGAANGNTALVELSALHARSLKEKVDRKAHLQERISRISTQLKHHRPKFALFYGLGNREHYERVTGVAFGEDNICWLGDTLCVLTPGPTARFPTACSKPEYWIHWGAAMRKLIEHRMAES